MNWDNKAFLVAALVTLMLSLSFMSVCYGMLALSGRNTANTATAVLWGIDWTVRDVDKAVNIMRSETHHLILEAALTAKAARQSSENELAWQKKELPIITKKVNALLDNGNKIAADVDATVKTVNESLKPVVPLLEAATNATKEVTTAAQTANKVIGDPNIPLAINHVQGMTTSGDKILKDAADYTHQFVHPEPAHGWHKVMRIFSTAGEVGLKMLEALYYGHGI